VYSTETCRGGGTAPVSSSESMRAQLERLEAHNALLRSELERELAVGPLPGRSEQVRELMARVERVAITVAPVLLTGETGTGKSRVARYLHQRSDRAHQPLVRIQCAEPDAAFLGRQLFGDQQASLRGTGAARRGRIELADGGTVLLDDISALPIDYQTRVLALIRDGQLTRLGAAQTVAVDVRVLATSRVSLADEVRAGRFREDLFYSLTVFPLVIPPLRKRPTDVLVTANDCARREARRHGFTTVSFTSAALDALRAYDWPGNLSELEATIARAVARSGSDQSIDVEHLGGIAAGPTAAPETERPDDDAGVLPLDDVIRDHLMAALESTDWVIEGHRGAAQLLGLAPATLRSRLKRHGIERPGATG